LKSGSTLAIPTCFVASIFLKGDWSRMLEFSVNLSATLFYRSFTDMHEFCERATPPTANEGAGESHHFVNA